MLRTWKLFLLNFALSLFNALTHYTANWLAGNLSFVFNVRIQFLFSYSSRLRFATFVSLDGVGFFLLPSIFVCISLLRTAQRCCHRAVLHSFELLTWLRVEENGQANDLNAFRAIMCCSVSLPPPPPLIHFKFPN